MQCRALLTECDINFPINIIGNIIDPTHLEISPISLILLGISCPSDLVLVDFAFMMTSSNGNIFRVTGPLCGEFTGPGEFPTQRPAMRSFDVFFDLRLNKWLSKQPWGWWFETPLWSLWRQRNVAFASLRMFLYTIIFCGIFTATNMDYMDLAVRCSREAVKRNHSLTHYPKSCHIYGNFQVRTIQNKMHRVH